MKQEDKQAYPFYVNSDEFIQWSKKHYKFFKRVKDGSPEHALLLQAREESGYKESPNIHTLKRCMQRLDELIGENK